MNARVAAHIGRVVGVTRHESRACGSVDGLMKANPEPGAHELRDGRDIADLHFDQAVEAGVGEQAVDSDPGSPAGRVVHEPLTIELGQGDTPAALQTVTRWACEQHLFGRDRVDVQVLGRSDGRAREREVEPALRDCPGKFDRPALGWAKDGSRLRGKEPLRRGVRLAPGSGRATTEFGLAQ
jgi:hypothetical protein